jgi:uncharacterized membrane protein
MPSTAAATFHSLPEPGLDNASSKLYRKAQPFVVAAMLACGRQVVNAQIVMLQQILLFIWKGEQGFALRGGQEFTAWHATILITNSVFENGRSFRLLLFA